MEGTIIKALRSQTKSLSLDNKNLDVLPGVIGKLHFLHTLSVKNNSLKSLPIGITHLTSVSISSHCVHHLLLCIYSLLYTLIVVDMSESW